ncbi:hypothetical protein HJG60_008665 [Phyllostomus discolor]|uniref:Uncharacterized protein n=1 Tax=Phyllostomus discolor TaxID=89673 RepID=A0A833Z0K9_9CHIR|nr:hypothetical protein HJG60_008665 [Phyllostomus discolor]
MRAAPGTRLSDASVAVTPAARGAGQAPAPLPRASLYRPRVLAAAPAPERGNGPRTARKREKARSAPPAGVPKASSCARADALPGRRQRKEGEELHGPSGERRGNPAGVEPRRCAARGGRHRARRAPAA